MTIRSSASLSDGRTRERLDKEQDNRNDDSSRKDEQNDRFPPRMFPTHYEARTR